MNVSAAALSPDIRHTKWRPASEQRFIASKASTTEWFKKLIELGARMGVETADIELPALHALHLLLKKKVDEKLRAQAKRVITATKKLAADEERVLIELRTKGALHEEEARDAAKEELELIALKEQAAKDGQETKALKKEAAKL
ncbi:hypothetical protein FN846DRAFT_890258 [Sphaerosporella brunnea]|uniref:Uncharacterized protein n=1 Tax=Sphaerosporella brunnea TaxID=1250544 RepID=A0A5J5EXB7_9PEZI|nr:hypothetical protein FN846DRAFT_890258 [Sphaerosporella brunnea]